MTVTPIVRCIATPQRIAWALMRAGLSVRAAQTLATTHAWTMGDARKIADAAEVSVAALYLPNPSHLELTRARIRGWRTKPPLWLKRWAAHP